MVKLNICNYFRIMRAHKKRLGTFGAGGFIDWFVHSFICPSKVSATGKIILFRTFHFFLIINIHKSTLAGQLANPLLPLKDLRASADGAAGAEQHVVKFRHVIRQGNTAIEYQLHPSVSLSVCLSLYMYVIYIYTYSIWSYMIIYEYQTFESKRGGRYRYVVMIVGDQKVGAKKTLLSAWVLQESTHERWWRRKNRKSWWWWWWWWGGGGGW